MKQRKQKKPYNQGKDKPNNPVNQGPQNYSLIVTNYSIGRSSDAILNVLKTLTFTHFGAYPSFFNKKEGDDKTYFIVSVLNHIQFDALLQLNGIFVYNYPIWIIAYPSNDYLAQHYQVFSSIFLSSLSDGQLDLSDFASKVALNGGDSSIVNFNNREFVEYLFFRLGVDSRDKKFWVSSIILCNNNIKAISPWASFFHFLPNLKYINLNNNDLSEQITQSTLPPYMQISIDYNGKIQYNNPLFGLQDGPLGDAPIVTPTFEDI